MTSPGRNDPCPCGSGKKYKKCCLSVANKTVSSLANTTSNQGLNATNVTSPSELLMKAVALHQAGKLDEAKTIYQKLLNTNPRDSDALHYLGLIAFQKHHYLDSVNLIEAAIKLNCLVPAFYCNLGNAYRALGQFDSAITAFQEAVRLDTKFPAAHNNLGNTLKDLGRLDEAITNYRKAIALKPDFSEAHNNLGIAFSAQGNHEKAVDSYRKALSLSPYYADAYGNLGNALKSMGKTNEALVNFQHQLRLAPDNSAAQHIVASLSGSNPERASSKYVEKLFDDYAEKFDLHLQQDLKYEIPEKLVALISQLQIPFTKKFDILDLGCGTGLVGVAIAPLAQQLVGVDLSNNMLKKAHARNIYRRLECLDLLTMIRSEKNSSYDIIVAADVLVYVGKLDNVFREAKRLLRPGGILGFSVETLDVSPDQKNMKEIQQEYRLEITGRYSHSTSYLYRLASENGFLIQKLDATEIRMENGKPVHGYLVIFMA